MDNGGPIGANATRAIDTLCAGGSLRFRRTQRCECQGKEAGRLDYHQSHRSLPNVAMLFEAAVKAATQSPVLEAD